MKFRSLVQRLAARSLLASPPVPSSSHRLRPLGTRLTLISCPLRSWVILIVVLAVSLPVTLPSKQALAAFAVGGQ